MYPHPARRDTYKFPEGGLLPINGIVPRSELCSPRQLDSNGEACLIVIKSGSSTGVTFGRTTGLESFVRRTDDEGAQLVTTEVGVLSYSHKLAPFSGHGDSGSLVVDGHGRIVGLLHGGTGVPDAVDVTYLTPYFWLEERIRAAMPGAQLYPRKN